MKLYEFGPTRSQRVRWTLQELEVPFEAIQVDLGQSEHRRPEFLALNPAAKLPVLVDGDLVLTESAAIVLYLGEKYPEKALLPVGLRQRAELNRWLLFTVTELEQPLWRIARQTFLYPPEQRLAADVPLAVNDFKPMAAVVDAHLRGRRFVVGEQVSVADFVLAWTLDWANEEKLLDDFPGLRTYLERMYRRPKAPLHIAEAFAKVQASS